MAEMRQLVRIINVDLKGERSVYGALREIKGVSFGISNAVCNILNFEKNKRIGTLTDEEIKKIEEIIKNPKEYGFPNFILNRRKDEDGINRHVITSDLKFKTEFDIKNMKKIKSYKGMRHSAGLPVRGQKTRSHFRKGKALGVKKGKKKGKKG